MRRLIPFLALTLSVTACGSIARLQVEKQVDSIIENCGAGAQIEASPDGNAELQCFAESLGRHCASRYRDGEIANERDWKECAEPPLGTYCDRGGNVAQEQCIQQALDLAWLHDPFVELLKQAFEVEQKRCVNRRETGELSTAVAYAECVNSGIIQSIRRYEFHSLFGPAWRMSAKRLELAKRVDAGTISETDAKREYEVFSEMCQNLPNPPECRTP